MTLITTPKTASPLTIPVDGTWKTVKAVSIPGASGETVTSAIWINCSGLLIPGAETGIIDVRALRDGGTNETGLQTFVVAGDKKNSDGLYTFKHYISHDWFMAKNMTTMVWQIRARRRIKSLVVKEGFYAKGTND